MLFWEQLWNFTCQNFDELLLKIGKKAANSPHKLVENFFWKRKMEFWQQLWKKIDKVRKNNSKSEYKTFVRKGLHSKVFPSRVPLTVSKAVPEQWYISLVENPKLSLKYEKIYEKWFSFENVLRLYLQTCGVLKWKQCRQKVRTGRKKSI